MRKIVSKVCTVGDYAFAGFRLGIGWRSKWLLASLLLRYKLRRALRFADSRIYASSVCVGDLESTLHIRGQDIFIVREVLADSAYIMEALLCDPPRCILDLGAHIGLATLRFKASFPEAIIHCYEPDPDNFQLLALNTKGIRGIVLRREAAAATSGEAVLYVYPHRHSASSLKPKGIGDKSVVEVTCVVKALDDILSGIDGVDLVKFDIEGMEYEVFSQSHLACKVKYIVGEIKSEPEDLRRFLALFPEHNAQWVSLTPKMHLVFLVRRHEGGYESKTNRVHRQCSPAC